MTQKDFCAICRNFRENNLIDMNLMIKNTLVLVLLIFSLNAAHAQKTIYTGGELSFTDNTGASRNIGKNVTLTFDAFFKSYKVVYTDINGNRRSMTFVWDGRKPYSIYTYDGNSYNCTDLLEAGLIQFGDVFIGGTGTSYMINGLKK